MSRKRFLEARETECKARGWGEGGGTRRASKRAREFTQGPTPCAWHRLHVFPHWALITYSRLFLQVLSSQQNDGCGAGAVDRRSLSV